jgi:hypothetical protein
MTSPAVSPVAAWECFWKVHLETCCEHVAKEMGYPSKQDFNRSYKAATGCTSGEAILQRQLQDAWRFFTPSSCTGGKRMRKPKRYCAI